MQRGEGIKGIRLHLFSLCSNIAKDDMPLTRMDFDFDRMCQCVESDGSKDLYSDYDSGRAV